MKRCDKCIYERNVFSALRNKFSVALYATTIIAVLLGCETTGLREKGGSIDIHIELSNAELDTDEGSFVIEAEYSTQDVLVGASVRHIFFEYEIKGSQINELPYEAKVSRGFAGSTRNPDMMLIPKNRKVFSPMVLGGASHGLTNKRVYVATMHVVDQDRFKELLDLGDLDLICRIRVFLEVWYESTDGWYKKTFEVTSDTVEVSIGELKVSDTIIDASSDLD